MKRLFNHTVIAHRGASADAPENTWASLHQAHVQGATWVECDVQLTSDHQPVIIHDETLSRVSTSEEAVSALTWAQLSVLDVGSWFHPQFADARVLPLESYLEEAYQLGISVNLEFKEQHDVPIDLLVSRVWPLLLASSFSQDATRLLLSSFSVSCLLLLADNSSQWPLGYLAEQWLPDYAKTMASCGAVSLHVPVVCVTEDRVKQCHADGYQLLVYTVNDPVQAHRLFDMGVDAVFSDHPSLLSTEVPRSRL